MTKARKAKPKYVSIKPLLDKKENPSVGNKIISTGLTWSVLMFTLESEVISCVLYNQAAHANYSSLKAEVLTHPAAQAAEFVRCGTIGDRSMKGSLPMSCLFMLPGSIHRYDEGARTFYCRGGSYVLYIVASWWDLSACMSDLHLSIQLFYHLA